MRSDAINSTIVGFGDLIPIYQMKWNAGVNNYMFYATGDMPAGMYQAVAGRPRQLPLPGDRLRQRHRRPGRLLPVAGGRRRPAGRLCFPDWRQAAGYLNLKAYGEFANENRPAGWNLWLTFNVSPAAPTPPTPSKPMFTK
jgi:hypothetical protein